MQISSVKKPAYGHPVAGILHKIGLLFRWVCSCKSDTCRNDNATWRRPCRTSQRKYMKSMVGICGYINFSQHVQRHLTRGLSLQQSCPHNAPRVNDGIARSEGRWCTIGLPVDWYLHVEHVIERSMICKQLWVGHESNGGINKSAHT